MPKFITYDFTDDFITRLTEKIRQDFKYCGKDFSRLALVFGGKRPELFLKKALAQSLKSAFIPPRFFSMDEFIGYIACAGEPFCLIGSIQAGYFIYQILSAQSPNILGRRKNFSDFLSWAIEIQGFIDELDLEEVSDARLKEVEGSAKIGYPIPENINYLLIEIAKIREIYHQLVRKHGYYSRGMLYKQAAARISEFTGKEFDKILFCNFYYLHKTEAKILKYLFDRDKALFFFQKDKQTWPVFKQLENIFGEKIEPQTTAQPAFCLEIFKGFDAHSQVGLVREILKKEIIEKAGAIDKTLILLPQAQNLPPLLAQLPLEIKEFNVSLGYPLKKSALYQLFRYIICAQETLKDGKYYSRDYLKVILQPFIKNLSIFRESVFSRILVHKIEEALLGIIKSSLSGSLFVSLDQIENQEEIYSEAMQTLSRLGYTFDIDELKKILRKIHDFSFRIWEDIDTFLDLSQRLEQFLDLLIENSQIGKYFLNIKVMEKLLNIAEEFSTYVFRDEQFDKMDILKVFDEKLAEEYISFYGSPLKGLQILGLLETRALTFENIIILDANEGVLPKMRLFHPLIPREVLEALGIESLRLEEEIQRYHFMRLISGAKNVYIVYDDSPEKERSRFVEQIIWQRQLSLGKSEVAKITQGRFNVGALVTQKQAVKKTKDILDYLSKTFSYSASSIDAYLICPLKFYYQYVLNLKEKEDLLAEPEAKDIGEFMHKFLELVFKKFLNRSPRIDDAFTEEFFALFHKKFEAELAPRLGAEAFMVKEIMLHRLKRFLEKENTKERGVKKILLLEKDISLENMRLGAKNLKFKYRIDRIDLLEDGSLLIIDYKTGGSGKAPAEWRILEKMELERKIIKEKISSFQLPIYYYFIEQQYKDKVVNAALYSLRDCELKYFFKDKELQERDQKQACCLKALDFIISQILDPEVDFVADEDEEFCQHCEFLNICR